MNERKAIPIGIKDFKILIDRQCYFVDKTLMIKELIESSATVTLFTAPEDSAIIFIMTLRMLYG